MLAHCLVVGADTISLADWHFTPSVPALRVQRDSMPLTFTAERGDARVALTYIFFADDYRFQVRGHVTGLGSAGAVRSEEHTSELQSQSNLVCRLLLAKKKK